MTITGTFTSGQLRILVAGTGDSWSNDPDDLLDNPGLFHLGLNGSDGIVVTDATLRARTRLSAYTAGDIRGVYELGQFQRVQCGADPEDPVGTVSAAITSLANGNAFGADENPIAALIAGDGISGTITATAGNIGLIQVGPHEDAAGISGDIISQAGAIHTIFSTGPIGNGETDPENFLNITAANGIGQIRTFQEGEGGGLLVRDVEANITANKAMLDNPTGFGYGAPASDGALGTLEVGGDLVGEVRAGNVTPTLGVASTVDGIFVHGVCYAPITIELTHSTAIVAQTFTEDISVGHSMSGMIVAAGGSSVFGVADGHIPSIEVGYGESPGRTAGLYAFVTPGLVGSVFNRAIPTADEAWFAVGDRRCLAGPHNLLH